MNCYHCNEKLIWGGDHDDEDNGDIITNLSCSKCKSFVIVHWGENDE